MRETHGRWCLTMDLKSLLVMCCWKPGTGQHEHELLWSGIVLRVSTFCLPLPYLHTASKQDWRWRRPGNKATNSRARVERVLIPRVNQEGGVMVVAAWITTCTCSAGLHHYVHPLLRNGSSVIWELLLTQPHVALHRQCMQVLRWYGHLLSAIVCHSTVMRVPLLSNPFPITQLVCTAPPWT